MLIKLNNSGLVGYIKNSFSKILKFLRSTDFSKAVVLTLAIGLPIGIFTWLDNLNIGIVLAMGCLLSAPSDVTGSLKHRVNGILLAATLSGIVTIIAGYAAFNLWVFIPVMGFLMFGISYLAVYGFRASLIAFSGLFAVVLSFANISEGLQIWQRGLLVSVGGMWYLSLSSLWYTLNPKRPTEQLLARCLEITATYLRTRANSLVEKDRRNELKRSLFSLQTEINEIHENLREVLIATGRDPVKSNYSRKRLLIFIELVDMLELAMANPVNYEKMDLLLKDNTGILQNFKLLIFGMATQLEEIGGKLDKNSRFTEDEAHKYFRKIDKCLRNIQKEIESGLPTESSLLLRNLYDYQKKQTQKIKSVLLILNNLEQRKHIFMKQKEASRFISSQDYDLKTLWINFNFGSPIFRHSLRLAVVVLVGFSIGAYFSLQNAYWILLTIVVIMRPNYGLTKQRSRQRIIGTLIGAVIAVGIVFTIQNEVVYAILGLFSLTLAFSLVQRNYRTSAIFVTLSIVFIYSLLQPDVLNVIRYRVIDTILGAGLAAVGNIVLWPAWERQGVKKLILGSLHANRKFLGEIDKFYREKGNLPITYKLARKKAFLEMGNLNASFQRMKEEPKSRQTEIVPVQEIVDLTQTFLSSLTALGTYIQNHPTTEASKDFKTFTDHISWNLKKIEKMLEKNLFEDKGDPEKLKKASVSLDAKFHRLLEESTREETEEDINLQLQEAQLIIEQLKWLLALSESLERRVSVLCR